MNECHLKNCIKYIHNNPVVAGIVKRCSNYEYSSYNDYEKNKMNMEIIRELYGEKDSYLNEISGKNEEYEFIDVDNEFGVKKAERIETVIKEYEKEDYTDKKVIYKVAREIKSRCLVTN